MWIAIGYGAAVMFAYVIWKCANIKRPDENEFGEDPFADEIEIEGLQYDEGDEFYRDHNEHESTYYDDD